MKKVWRIGVLLAAALAAVFALAAAGWSAGDTDQSRRALAQRDCVDLGQLSQPLFSGVETDCLELPEATRPVAPAQLGCDQQGLGQATLIGCDEPAARGGVTTVRWGEFCTDDCERLLDRVCQSSPWPQRCGGWMNPINRQLRT